MEQVKRVGYEIKALSNLMRRRIWENLHIEAHCDMYTEMQGMIVGVLCRNTQHEIFQKDLEQIFYIRRSTASRLLKKMEQDGLIIRRSVARDARLKQVLPTQMAFDQYQQIQERIEAMEGSLTQGISNQEIEQFMITVEKLKKNLMEREHDKREEIE